MLRGLKDLAAHIDCECGSRQILPRHLYKGGMQHLKRFALRRWRVGKARIRCSVTTSLKQLRRYPTPGRA